MELQAGLRTHPDLTEFQVHVAERWLEAARKLEGRNDRTPEFEFISCFGAFNALYWLWGEVTDAQAFDLDERHSIENAVAQLPRGPRNLQERVRSRVLGLAGEPKLIDGLVRSLGSDVALGILTNEGTIKGVQYLLERGPIQRMDRREPSGITGSIEEGRRHQRRLRDEQDPSERLRSLAQILYVVRCNLVHGSKMVDGYDIDLLQRCAPALRLIAEASLTLLPKQPRTADRSPKPSGRQLTIRVEHRGSATVGPTCSVGMPLEAAAVTWVVGK